MARPLFRRPRSARLFGKRIMLRPLVPTDFDQWSEVRLHNEEWLVPWEPQRPNATPDPQRSRAAFESRCQLRERERAADHAYPFGMFLNDRLIGEVNLNNVTRGALQTATVGYWIDRRHAGNSYTSEGVVVLAKYSFEQLHLHRIEICIVPRNTNSRRVMEKLDIREEGTALRFLEINGVWEDHVRYGMTVEDWNARQVNLAGVWLTN